MTAKNAEPLPIYLDYMATTPVDPRVVEKMGHYLGEEGIFGNPASMSHVYGVAAYEAVEEARALLAQSLGALPTELIFTSGATEANNLAIIGAAHFYGRKGKHVITMQTEHPSVIDSFRHLEKEGFEVTYLPPEADGLLNLRTLSAALRKDTILVSIMQVNNEIGVVQDIAAIGELLSQRGIVFHVDAAQSAGKIPINLQALQVSLMSFSGHKNYGPKGVGALYVRQKPRIRLQALSFGGEQERGLRSGTLATHQIVGMAEAFHLSQENLNLEQARILAFRKKIWNAIADLPGIHLNGHEDKRIAGNLNISFAGIDPDSLMLALKDLAISRTSACASASQKPSYVLKALGLPDDLAYSSVRLSIGRFTTEADVERIISLIHSQVQRLRNMLPS